MKAGTIIVSVLVLGGLGTVGYLAWKKYGNSSQAPTGTLTPTVSSTGAQVYVDQAGKIFDSAGTLLNAGSNAVSAVADLLKPTKTSAPGVQLQDSAGNTFRFSNTTGKNGWKIVINGQETVAEGTDLYIANGVAYHKNKLGDYYKYAPENKAGWVSSQMPSGISGLSGRSLRGLVPYKLM